MVYFLEQSRRSALTLAWLFFYSDRGLATSPQQLPVDLDAVAAEIEWRTWREMVAAWNLTVEGGKIHYPVNTPDEAECVTGSVVMIGGRSFQSLRSQRARSMNEAGYGMCPQHSLQIPGCVIYSCGVDEDPSFEVHIAKLTQCDVFAFDPSPAARRWMGYLMATAEPTLPANLHFLPWGWSSRDISTRVDPHTLVEVTGDCHNCNWPWDTSQWGKPSARWEMKRISLIAKYFNHSRVDLVKLDCEGVEYSPGFIEDLIALKPEQIILEQHPNRQVVETTNISYQQVSAVDWLVVQDMLHAAGYRQVWKGRLASDLGEYTLAHRRFTDIMRQHRM